MERGQRIGLIVLAVVIAAVGIVLIQAGGDDDETDSVRTDTGRTQTDEPTATVRAPKPRPQPEFQKIAIVGGEVRGGEQEIEVKKGETARIEVTSDAPDDIHLHGYDLSKPVAPGRPARFRFTAGLEGIFELEAHDLGNVTIATLVVEP